MRSIFVYWTAPGRSRSNSCARFLAACGGEWQRRGGGRGRVGGPAAGAQVKRGGRGHGRLLVGERRGAQATGVQLDWLQAPVPDDQGAQAQAAGQMSQHLSVLLWIAVYRLMAYFYIQSSVRCKMLYFRFYFLC